MPWASEMQSPPRSFRTSDTAVCMGTDVECISCDTARASARNKETHTVGQYPGEYVFMDILYPVVSVGLTKTSTFPFYFILVNAYSRYLSIYGLPTKSLKWVIDVLTRFQADNGHIGNYGYPEIARIRTDSGSQLTSEALREHCWKAGIN